MLSESSIEPALREIAAWKIFDANVRVGRSGMHGQLALEAPELLAEMDRFGIERALVAHFAAEEYDAAEGNRALAGAVREAPGRFEPAWATLPDAASIDALASLRPAAVRLSFGVHQHNFSAARWCSGALFEYLEAHNVLAVVERQAIAWESLDALLSDFPRLKVLLIETGYRADRNLRPLLRRHANLHFDSSTFLAHRQLEAFVEQCGPDRLVFGSRLPLYTPGAALAVLASARVSDEARLAVAGGTLRRLIGGERE
ncbi:MAG: amidohydrolase family protein [Terriglobia bacterium]